MADPTQILMRRDTTSRWAATNPVLGAGEPSADMTDHTERTGDGTTPYLLLPYFAPIDATTHLPVPAVVAALDERNDSRYQPLGTSERAASITVEYKKAAAGYYYSVIRARTDGRFLPGIVDKRFGNDFDVTNPSSTGQSFIPTRERLDSYALRTGAAAAVNASGWRISGNIGEIKGPQIRNGRILHDFDASDLSGSVQGIEAIGMRSDGHLKCYSALNGDTAASMVADGVVHSWSFGPNLVIDGVAQDLTQKAWAGFLTEISARTIIGQSPTGDIVIIALVGKTSTVGITGNDMVALAVAEGCYNAGVLDGGGSTQAWVQGVYAVPSSDDATGMDGTVARRAVPDVFLLRGTLTTDRVDTGWVDIPLRTGYKAVSADLVPQIRQRGSHVVARGQVAPTTGTIASGSSVTFGDLPQQFRTKQLTKAFNALGDGSNNRKVAILADFSMLATGGSGTPAYLALDSIDYEMD